MFTTDQLSSPERDEKWDRVKIVCTQPFNRHVQYGLSFITLHSPEDKTAHTPVQQTIGRFVLRPPSPDNIAVGSTFLKRKETPESTSVSGTNNYAFSFYLRFAYKLLLFSFFASNPKFL